jgi:spore germination protein KB
MKVKIDRIQYFFMIPNIVYGKAIGITSGIVTRVVGGDVWLAMSIGFLTGALTMILMVVVGSRFPEKDMLQYGEELLGKWINKIFGVVLAMYFAFAFAESANVVTLHIKEYLLPETPFIFICIAYALLCIYAAVLGIEVVIRFSLFGFIMIFLINITMVLGTMNDFQLINLLPILDRGIVENVKASVYSYADVAMAILIIGMVYPMLNDKKNAAAISFWSMILGAFAVIIWPFFEVGVLGADVMKQFTIVCMQQVRSAQLTRYLPRYELIMVSFFIWGCIVKTALIFYCCQYSIKHVTKIKNNWIIFIPLTIGLILLTYYTGYDDNKYINLSTFPWPQISAILGLGVPVMLFMLALFKSKFSKRSC